MTILDFLKNNSISGPFACGGKGRCGKCKVRISSLSIPISSSDKKYLTTEELDNNIRLACTADYYENISLEDIEILWESDEEIHSESGIDYNYNQASGLENDELKYGIAIDIGTTTIAACLVNLTCGIVVGENTISNRGRAYGADVISRIEAANSGRLKVLNELLIEDIKLVIYGLLNRQKVDLGDIHKITIAGNTTMEHLLSGYDCMGLGKYPFKPYSLKLENITADRVIKDKAYENIPLTILPGISAFVGADIVSGLFEINIMDNSRPIFFIDLGTNGEMALGCRDKLLVSSTAAGPAFEGCNINCGMASIPGAIMNVEIRNNRVRPRISSIGNKTPIGICGSGLIAAVSEMKDNNIIDENGTLAEEYFEKGYGLIGNIAINQADIRELQKAKSAIRAGIEVLLEEYGIKYSDIEHVYLAGGFGKAMNVKHAINIGILPKEFAGITEAIGNASLKGAIKYLYNDDIRNLNTISHTAKEITLANMANFNDKFLKYMNF